MLILNACDTCSPVSNIAACSSLSSGVGRVGCALIEKWSIPTGDN